MRRILITHLWTDAERHFIFHASFLCSFLCHSFHNKNVGESASGGGQNWSSDLRTEKFTRVMKWTNLNCTLSSFFFFFSGRMGTKYFACKQFCCEDNEK